MFLWNVSVAWRLHNAATEKKKLISHHFENLKSNVFTGVLLHIYVYTFCFSMKKWLLADFVDALRIYLCSSLLQKALVDQLLRDKMLILSHIYVTVYSYLKQK